MTLAMLRIDSARTRLPMACTVISMLVLAMGGALGFISCMLETTNTVSQTQGTHSVSVPFSGAPDANPPDAADSLESDPWVRHAREF